MIEFTDQEFRPTQAFNDFLSRYGGEEAGEVIGSIVLANMESNESNPYAACYAFMVEGKIENEATQHNFMRGVASAVNRATRGGNQQ
jgi:hypothetical protein